MKNIEKIVGLSNTNLKQVKRIKIFVILQCIQNTLFLVQL